MSMVAENERHHHQRAGGWRSKTITTDHVQTPEEIRERIEFWREQKIDYGDGGRYSAMCDHMIGRFEDKLAQLQLTGCS